MIIEAKTITISDSKFKNINTKDLKKVDSIFY